jgi:hypothetical protein
MRSAEKLVSQEDMWKVLEKHGATRPKEVQTAKPELRKPMPVLEWETAVRTGPNSGFALSKCGRYSVSMDSVMGKAMFTAWARRSGERPERMIGIRDQPEEAKHLCQLDQK